VEGVAVAHVARDACLLQRKKVTVQSAGISEGKGTNNFFFVLSFLLTPLFLFFLFCLSLSLTLSPSQEIAQNCFDETRSQQVFRSPPPQKKSQPTLHVVRTRNIKIPFERARFGAHLLLGGARHREWLVWMSCSPCLLLSLLLLLAWCCCGTSTSYSTGEFGVSLKKIKNKK